MTAHRNARDDSGRTRVPPHNLEAEASALGAALLKADAADVLVSTLTPADFFKPTHQHIAAAMLACSASGDGVDVVTVAEQLRQSGLLADIGGPVALLDLQNATPATSRAAAYCRIVKDAAVLRRLVATAAAIAELGYAASDPSTAVHSAGELLSRMDTGDATRLATIELADVAALLASDLQPEQPALLVRNDGAALLYSGKMHVLQAEPSSGKSWLALAAVAEVLALGGAVIYLDFEDTAPGILSRLRTLGVPDDAIRARFIYIQIPGKFGPADRLALGAVLDRLNPDLVILDGVGESMAREGLSEDKAEDVLRWTDLLPRPIARSGAAVLMIDHVAKDPEQRGRWARGSGAKLGAVDGASYQVKVRQPFSRHRAGRVDLVVAKDRPGGVGAIGETVATVHIEPAGAGALVKIRVEVPAATTAAGDSWKPTVLMRKVWEAVAAAAGAGNALTPSAVSSLVHASKPALVREALARLLAEGYLVEEGRRPKVLKPVKAYTDGAPAGSHSDRTPPPDDEVLELDFDDDRPTPEEIAELDRWRSEFYSSAEF